MKNLPDCKINSLATWSFRHFFCAEYEEAFLGVNDNDFLLARAKFIDHFGFDTSGIDVDLLNEMCKENLERLLVFLDEKMITFHPLLESCNFSTMSAEEAKTFAEEYAQKLVKYEKFFKNKTITCNVHSGSRFDDEANLEEKLETIAHNLTPVVNKVGETGYRVAIENAGDFYTSEIVRICQSVPGLMMTFDMGNPYLIGEDLMQAVYTAAPFTLAVHVRDLKVCPEPYHQIIRMHYAPLGEGNVDIERCLEVILANCPDPLSLLFETEILDHEKYGQWESLEKEINYINSIQA